MTHEWCFILLCAGPLVWKCTQAELLTDETSAKAFLADYNSQAALVFPKYIHAYWNYSTNLTDYNQALLDEPTLEWAAFTRDTSEQAVLYDWENFQDEDLRREFATLIVTDTAHLSEEEIIEVDTLNNDMLHIYSTGQVCYDNGTCLDLDPGLTDLFATSRNYSELEWAWKAWRDATGKLMRDDFTSFVELQNKAANLNGHEDTGVYWRSWYETEDFESEIHRLWGEVAPLYKQLHAYTRRKLQAQYPYNLFPESGHIPAHILGNMWAQSWLNLQDLLIPYPNVNALDLTATLKQQNYTVEKMVKLAEEFFKSLGFEPLPNIFYEKSMFVKPEDRDVTCHGGAWDFYDNINYRISICATVTGEWLLWIYQMLGMLEYQVQYMEQPITLKGAANPGFFWAIAELIPTSAFTPEHLHEIGLLNNVQESHEADINHLMIKALDIVAFLPFGFLVDQWRWDVFSETTKPENYNEHWWNYRCKYQGVSPPVSRSEEDFDPGAKFHVPAHASYVNYFVSYMLQFQMHRGLCVLSGNTKPLYQCNIHDSTVAGQRLIDMLKLGYSKPWMEALNMVAGSAAMDAQPLLDYFQPLYDWLVEQNAGHSVGWEDECPVISAGTTSTPTIIPTITCIALTLAHYMIGL